MSYNHEVKRQRIAAPMDSRSNIIALSPTTW